MLCAPPLVCRGGHCVEDECFYIICPDGYHCEAGTCEGGGGPTDGGTDADGSDGRDGETGDAGDGADGSVDVDRANVLATGAGGCTCRTTGGGTGSGGILALFALLACGLVLRLRARPPRTPRTPRTLPGRG
jgi:hypothetical protein